MEVSQLLVYALLIAGFMLFNFLLQRAARRARALQEQERARQEALAAQAAETVPLDEAAWGREPLADRQPAAGAGEPAPRAVTPAAPSPVRRRVALFRDTDDLRRAVVAMTVLGPCRALDPPERG